MTYYKSMISNETIEKINEFPRVRGWQDYQTPGNLAKSISIEAAELLECFQWDESGSMDTREHICEELADVMIYCIHMAHVLDVDLDDIIDDKLAKSALKYPVEE